MGGEVIETLEEPFLAMCQLRHYKFINKPHPNSHTLIQIRYDRDGIFAMWAAILRKWYNLNNWIVVCIQMEAHGTIKLMDGLYVGDESSARVCHNLYRMRS